MAVKIPYSSRHGHGRLRNFHKNRGAKIQARLQRTASRLEGQIASEKDKDRKKRMVKELEALTSHIV